jgi:hypothetical protein
MAASPRLGRSGEFQRALRAWLRASRLPQPMTSPIRPGGAWDANLYTWTQDAINQDFRGQLREEFNILTFVQDKLLTGASMTKPFGSAGFSINCPIVLRLD